MKYKIKLKNNNRICKYVIKRKFNKMYKWNKRAVVVVVLGFLRVNSNQHLKNVNQV